MATTTKRLVIVESPTKAKTISKYLGSGWSVEASFGHVRDLPKSAKEMTPEQKKQYGALGIDIDDGFAPLYLITKKDKVRDLKAALKGMDELYLATDEDREGEAISWHLLETLKPKIPVKRMVFHEISRKAIEEAAANPRELDDHLIVAQEARRIADRLYGYPVSEVLWKAVKPGLSAGRVQSVFVKLIVDREWERIRFVSSDWWDLTAHLNTSAASNFDARLLSVGGTRVATSDHFNERGELKRDDVVHLDEAEASRLQGLLAKADYTVSSVETKPYRSSPKAPFTTSTMQQESGRKLRFGAQRTMRLAQSLYEKGYITYIRTDSVNLSEEAVTAARSQIVELYGNENLPPSPRVYASKSRNAQEAHEAIRPGGDTFRKPETVAAASDVNSDEARLYELIWKRTVASQMIDAAGQSVQARINAKFESGDAEFAASGRTITNPGYLRAYVEGSDDPDADLADRERILPELSEGQSLNCDGVDAEGHSTKPPSRYTEASLIAKADELGVGRPSTLSSMIGTIEDRGYVWKKGSALVPSWVAFPVMRFLGEHFPNLVDPEYTARLEADLDEIAGGGVDRLTWLSEFWNGQNPGLNTMVTKVKGMFGEIDLAELNTIDLGLTDDGTPIVVRHGKFGPFLRRGDDTANMPPDIAPDELTAEKAIELLNAKAAGPKILGTDADSGKVVLAKSGTFGPYVQLGEDDDQDLKRASLFKHQTLDSLSLDEALELLTLPRTVGEHTGTGKPITANNGKYGPYLAMEVEGAEKPEFRSLAHEAQLFNISLEQAEQLFAVPKWQSKRNAAAMLDGTEPGAASAEGLPRELGPDPVSGKTITVRDGRFGPYVTDGETNVSLKKTDDPLTVSTEYAAERLQWRRDNPSKKKTTRKKTAKKTTRKKKS